jgi:hypothetical protein
MKIKNVDPEKFIARMNELLTQHPDFNVEMGLFEASAPGARARAFAATIGRITDCHQWAST